MKIPRYKTGFRKKHSDSTKPEHGKTSVSACFFIFLNFSLLIYHLYSKNHFFLLIPFTQESKSPKENHLKLEYEFSQCPSLASTTFLVGMWRRVIGWVPEEI